MTKSATKAEVDAKLDEALKETFPASDPSSTNVADAKPVRPVHRLPPLIDPGLVEELARRVKIKTRGRRLSSIR